MKEYKIIQLTVLDPNLRVSRYISICCYATAETRSGIYIVVGFIKHFVFLPAMIRQAGA